MNHEPRARTVVVVAGSVPDGWAATLAARSAGLRHHRFYEFSLLSRRQVAWLENARASWSGGGGG